MSFYDDYVSDGLCCQSCGSYIGDEPGYPRYCFGCDPERKKPAKAIDARSAGTRSKARPGGRKRGAGTAFAQKDPSHD